MPRQFSRPRGGMNRLALAAMTVVLPVAGMAGGLSVHDLRCDLMVDPLGVDARPSLSWKLRSDELNQVQAAWQVQAASTLEDLLKESGLLWDSGKMTGDSQLHIPYSGRELSSSESVHWRVRVWDGEDRAGAWSDPATWTTGIVDSADWKAAWITHPQWLEHTREHLGYRSRSADDVNTTKWIQLDLGQNVSIDEVILRGLRHTVAERLGFPTQFVLEVSRDANFAEAVVLVDSTTEPYNPWLASHRIEGRGVTGRYLRLTCPVLRDLDGQICLALSQIEVISDGTNVALRAEVTASDSIESGPWKAAAVVDGKGIPEANPVANETIVLGREFNVQSGVRRAVAHVTGLGHYVLMINGERVGEAKLSPGWTDYSETVLYDSHDLTGYLANGLNRIGITLAGGMYSVPDPGGRYTKFIGRFQSLRALFQLEIEYMDGSVERVVSDPSWSARKGPVTFSHVYGGEDLDLRKAAVLWDGFSTRGNGWVPAELVDVPVGQLKGASHAAPPIRVIEHLGPVLHMRENEGNVDVYDLNQNAAIIPHLGAIGPEGSRIRIISGELLKDDNTVDRGSSGGGRPAWWELTLDGRDEPVYWQPEFFYHGARYLQVERHPAREGGELPTVISLTGFVIHTGSPPAGEFSCSSELFNRTRELIRWAQRSNLVSVITDCPHRERLGWLEQYHLNGPALRYEFDLTRLFAKTFGDMADAQTAEGLVPNIAPEYITFDGAFRDSPEWGSAVILAAWQQYLFSGDTTVFERHYDTMGAYMDYLASMSDEYLLDHGLGDWYDLGPGRPGFSQLTPPAVTATATWYENAVTLSRMAALLGREQDVAAWDELALSIRSAFNETFLDRETGSYATGSQTANAMAYYLGLVPDELEDKVLDSIVKDIRSRGNAFTSGDVGHAYLLRALAKGDRSDVIHDMHHQSIRPGYGMQLEKGATSLTEAWDAGRQSSQNHFMLGHIIEWFYHDLLGIAPSADGPGFQHVVVRPQPCGDITWARGSHLSPYGRISVNWERAEELFILTVELPVNTRGTLHLPFWNEADARETSGDSPSLVLPQRMESGRLVVEVGSGRHVFEVRSGSRVSN